MMVAPMPMPMMKVFKSTSKISTMVERRAIAKKFSRKLNFAQKMESQITLQVSIFRMGDRKNCYKSLKKVILSIQLVVIAKTLT